MRHLIIFAAVIAVLAATTTVAQPTAGQIALVNDGGMYGNALVGMGRYGNVTTILPLPPGTPSGIAVHDRGGPDLIIDGHKLYEYKNGVLRTLTASLAKPALDVTVMEDSGYVFAANTHVLTLNRLLGTRGTLATSFKRACDIALNGMDGSVMVVDDVAETVTQLTGDTVTKTYDVKEPRCMTWDPYTGYMFVACEGILLHLTPDGRKITLSVGTPGLTHPVGLFLRTDRTLLIAQGGVGDAMPGVYAYNGETGRYYRTLYERSSIWKGLSPADITVEHSRDLWPMSAAVIGETLWITVNFPAYKSWPFYAALSFDHKPGIELGNYRLHLQPDALFFASAQTPELIQHQGWLGTSGNGKFYVKIPKIKELAGLRIYAGVVVPDARRPDGVGIVSYAMGFTIHETAP